MTNFVGNGGVFLVNPGFQLLGVRKIMHDGRPKIRRSSLEKIVIQNFFPPSTILLVISGGNPFKFAIPELSGNIYRDWGNLFLQQQII